MDDNGSVDSGSHSGSRRRVAPSDRPVPLPKSYADLFRQRYREFDERMELDPRCVQQVVVVGAKKRGDRPCDLAEPARA